MGRAQELMRTRPRVFDKVEDSVEEWLVDEAWLVRLLHTVGTDDGEPNQVEAVAGPYLAKLSDAVTTEDREADRTTRSSRRMLAVEMDLEPLESDKIHVHKDGKVYVCHVNSDVEPRRAPWGQTVIWHLEIEHFDEY